MSAKEKARAFFDTIPKEVKAQYGQAYFDKNLEIVDTVALAKASNPDLVVTALLDALFTVHPKHRYLVGMDALTLWRAVMFMPTFISDRLLNLIVPPQPIAALQPRAQSIAE